MAKSPHDRGGPHGTKERKEAHTDDQNHSRKEGDEITVKERERGENDEHFTDRMYHSNMCERGRILLANEEKRGRKNRQLKRKKKKGPQNHGQGGGRS